MVLGINDIQNLNKKRQLAYDEAYQERQEDLTKAVNPILWDWWGLADEEQESPNIICQQVVEAVLKLDERK